MSARFTELKIAGFKSFADPVVVPILAGLTAIVGPNGCGKSNIVEAFRWIMGESSARALRGGDSDDLIFAGTLARAPRNLIEVSLRIEGARGLASPPHDGEDTLEISRTAKRGSGSEFRINGRAARAHDVTQIFADLSLGGRSLAVVSQNRIGSLIEAKPLERRSLLENAAGISGLHFRRRDAELKLKQAEANLSRAGDGLQQLIERSATLEAQAGAAKIYKKSVEAIRLLEATLYTTQYMRVERQLQESRAQIEEASKEVAARDEALNDLHLQRKNAADAMSALTLRSEASRNAIEACRIDIERARHALAQAHSEQTRLKSQLEQTEAEEVRLRARLDKLHQDENARLEKMTQLEARLKEVPARIAQADTALTAATSTYNETTQRRENAERLLFEARAQASTLSQQRATIDQHLLRSQEMLKICRQRLEAALTEMPDPRDVAELTSKVKASETTVEQQKAARDARYKALQDLKHQLDASARDHFVSEQDVIAAEAELARQNSRLLTLNAQCRSIKQRQAEAAAAILSDAAIKALDAGARTLQTAYEACQKKEETLRRHVTRAQEAHTACQSAEQRQTQHVQYLQEQLTLIEARYTELQTRQQENLAKIAMLKSECPDDSVIEEAELDRERVQKDVETLQKDEARLALSRDDLIKQLQQHDATLLQLEASRIALEAEQRGLKSLLTTQGKGKSLLNALQIPNERLTAVGAVLQSAIDAQLDDANASRTWVLFEHKSCGPLPHDVAPLLPSSDVPHVLGSFLAATGVVSSHAQGDALHSMLRPGQTLVAEDGTVWRWDGYRQIGGEPSEAEHRLRAKARNQAIDKACVALGQEHAAAVEARATAQKALTEKERRLAQTRADLTSARSAYEAKNNRSVAISAQKQRSEDALKYAYAHLADHTHHFDAVTAQREAAKAAIEALPEIKVLKARDREAAKQLEVTTRALEHAVKARIQAQAELSRYEQNRMQKRANDQSARARACDLATNLDECEDELRKIDIESLRHALATRIAKRDGLRDVHQDFVHQHLKLQTEFEDVSHAADEAIASEKDLISQLRAMKNAEMTQAAAVTALREQETALLQNREEAIAQREALPPIPEFKEHAAQLELLKTAQQDARNHLDTVRREKFELETQFRHDDATRDAEAQRGTDLQTQIEAYQSDLLRSAHRIAQLKTELDAVQSGEHQAKEHEADLTAALAKAEGAHDALKQDLQLQQDFNARLSASITACEAQRADASARINIAREKLTNASRLQDRLRESPPPETCKTVPSDISERAEQTLRRDLNLATQARDQLGAVNLLAEEEYQAARAQIDTTQRDIAEIQTAITKLQDKIAELNQEGRKRLKSTFNDVDRQFQRLFTRVFGGGKANLALVGGDDPLEAGLEIYAQPPGKKLSTLSLLSGGEQALTALALLFATFACQPAPICILDEVDAPLDEANTVRLCTLVREITEQYHVQFLIVTHQQVTMAYMDRLYGVTMQERGVSRLLAVDLSRAEQFAEMQTRET